MKKGHFKKLLSSIFAAVLLVCVLLVPGFAKTDAEKELEAATAQVAELEQKVADCQVLLWRTWNLPTGKTRRTPDGSEPEPQ